MKEYTVNMKWDNEASVWVGICDDIPIALESDSFDVLVKKIKLAAPEMLELNGKNPKCKLNFIAERSEDVA